jgi:hypothetical protein
MSAVHLGNNDDDDDDDLHWVGSPTVPMQLGLIDRPFSRHNLISAQKSPVPLPKFQMVPRFKMFMSSESKKGTHIYYPFLSKSPGKRIPSKFPNGAPMERGTLLQDFFAYLLICIYLKGPNKRASLLVRQKRSPYGKRRPYQNLT